MSKKNKQYLITWKNTNNNTKGDCTVTGIVQLEQQLGNLQGNANTGKIRVNILKKGKTYRVKRLKTFELTEVG